MCTVLLRLAPDAPWPVLVAAVRDEFADRAWDPPAAHWTGAWAGLVGGRDATAGGTWLAVDPSPSRPAVAALLNGTRRPPLPHGGARPTRGTLALDVLTGRATLDDEALVDYDGFHLLVATLDGAEMWSWDGSTLRHRHLEPGNHILVNLGVDVADDPLVPHFAPLLAALPDPLITTGAPTQVAWAPWTDLLRGDGLEPDDPRALIVRREVEGRIYASTSASLVALGRDRVRYDFSGDPTNVGAWHEVAVVGPGGIEPPTEEL